MVGRRRARRLRERVERQRVGQRGQHAEKHAREREECERTAEGSSEKDLIRVRRGTVGKPVGGTPNPSTSIDAVRTYVGGLYGRVCVRPYERMYACPTALVSYSLLFARGALGRSGSHWALSLCTNVHVYYVYIGEPWSGRDRDERGSKIYALPPSGSRIASHRSRNRSPRRSAAPSPLVVFPGHPVRLVGEGCARPTVCGGSRRRTSAREWWLDGG